MSIPPNPGNPYFNTDEYEYAIINNTGDDPMEQQRCRISPSSLAGVQDQELPWAKMHGTQHSQEAPTWNTPHSFKRGNMVMCKKVGDEWFIFTNPGTITK